MAYVVFMQFLRKTYAPEYPMVRSLGGGAQVHFGGAQLAAYAGPILMFLVCALGAGFMCRFFVALSRENTRKSDRRAFHAIFAQGERRERAYVSRYVNDERVPHTGERHPSKVILINRTAATRGVAPARENPLSRLSVKGS